MIITQTTVNKDGSCNFCNKGELSLGGRGLLYPYEKVYSLTSGEGGGLKARICQECIKKLIEFTKTQ